jgi:hypothetical protein
MFQLTTLRSIEVRSGIHYIRERQGVPLPLCILEMVWVTGAADRFSRTEVVNFQQLLDPVFGRSITANEVTTLRADVWL